MSAHSVSSSSTSTLLPSAIIELNSIVSTASCNHVLVSFHYVGSNGRFMKPSGKYFEENNIMLLGVNMPGRTNDSDTLTSIDAIVDYLYPQIKSALLALKSKNPNLEIIFFGHSMGGMVAFEIARGFEQDIDEESQRPVISIARLIVSAVRDPFQLSVFNSEPNNPLLNNSKSDEYIKNHAIRLGGLPVGIDPMFLQKAIPVMRKDYEALESYNESRQLWGGTKLSCPITVFAGNLDVYVHDGDMKTWNVWTTSSCSTKHFRGGHFYFTETHLKAEFLKALKDLCILSTLRTTKVRSTHFDDSKLSASAGGSSEEDFYDPSLSSSNPPPETDSKSSYDESSEEDAGRMRARTVSFVDSRK